MHDYQTMPIALSMEHDVSSLPEIMPAPPPRTKALFVGDNTSAVNWGRGASIALGQQLATCFEITGRITCDFFDLSTAKVGYVRTCTPTKYYKLFAYSLNRRRRRPFSWYIKLEELLGAKDFIAEDPQVSIDNLLFCKRRNPHLARIYDQAREADMFVVDGDGDIIFFHSASPDDSLSSCHDRTGRPTEEACLSCKFDDFRLSTDRAK